MVGAYLSKRGKPQSSVVVFGLPDTSRHDSEFKTFLEAEEFLKSPIEWYELPSGVERIKKSEIIHMSLRIVPEQYWKDKKTAREFGDRIRKFGGEL